MVVIICPETGKVLDSDRIDFKSYASRLWGVKLKDVDRLTNKLAKERYMFIVNAGREEES